jgi:hypothetical protein
MIRSCTVNESENAHAKDKMAQNRQGVDLDPTDKITYFLSEER